jgi:phosphatidate cytidylyltransferase
MERAEGVPLPAAMNSAGGGAVRRVLSAILMVPIILGVMAWGPRWLFAVLVLAASALAQWEFLRMFRRGGVEAFTALGIVGVVGVTGSFLVPHAVPTVLTMVVLVVLTAGLSQRERTAWEPVAVTLVGICYIGLLLGHALWLRDLPAGVGWLLFLVAVTWTGETAAYVVGSTLGRHKLAPRVSPGKTVEGALAQLVCASTAAVIVHGALFPERDRGEAVVLGLLLGAVGQIGDLVESVLKRSLGAKDSGATIPGHGGLLDRIDGLLFCAPVLFYCLSHGRALNA